MTGTLLLILSFVFAAAGVAKLRAPDPFKAGLRKLVHPALVRPTSLAVPLLELALAAWLVSGLATGVAAACAAILLAFFSVVLLRMWRIGLEGCGCFGEQAEGGGFATGMARNLILTLAAAVVVTRPEAPVFERTISGILGQATVVLGVVCLWTCAAAAATRLKWILGRSTTA